MISPVMTMFGYLQKPLLDSAAAGSVAFTNAASAVDSSLSTMPATSPYNLQGFVSMFLGPLSSVVAPEGAAWLPFAYGMLSDAINYGLTGVTDNSGNPALDTFDSKKGQIGDDAVTRLQKAAGQISLMEQLVLTDWTKLSTAAHNATTIWSLNDWTTAQQTAMVTASTKQWLYTTMVPQAYTQMQVTPSAADGGLTIDGINTFSCTYSLAGFEQWANPFVSSGGTKLPASAAFTPIVGTNADGTPVSSYMYGLGNATGHQNLQTPSASLTDPLFQSVDNGGVGLNQEQFYTWSWDSSNRKDILKLEGKPLGYPDKCG
jgi:hypothetical protein